MTEGQATNDMLRMGKARMKGGDLSMLLDGALAWLLIGLNLPEDALALLTRHSVFLHGVPHLTSVNRSRTTGEQG
jgi:hypothetical protein